MSESDIESDMESDLEGCLTGGDASEYEIEDSESRIENNVNGRAGHIAVEYNGTALVWGGYKEVPPEFDEHEYWPTDQVWQYNYLDHTWQGIATRGDTPTRCSGTGACLLDDRLYIVAGFHRVLMPRAYHVEDDEEDPELISDIEISNSIWSLDLRSLIWKKHQPEGIKPLRCDKTSVWAYDEKVFLFGGFALIPDHQYKNLSKKFQFLVDSASINERYTRGWTNQLVYFHTRSEKWVWPDCVGAPPSPRAAHSSVVIGDRVYIFGGRSDDVRLNDLYSLDLRSLTWSVILGPSPFGPIGRSWQSLNSIHTGACEGGLLLYGGFDNEKNPLSDCWRMDLSVEPATWIRQKQFEAGPRLWHASVSINQSTVMLIGGLTNNILAPNFITKLHSEKVLYLQVDPPSLFNLTLEFVSKNPHLFRSYWSELPFNLRKILEVRAAGA